MDAEHTVYTVYTIGQVSQFLGISRDTLKFYEQKGLISPGKNWENGYRCYTRNDIYDILAVNFYRELDIEIREIQQLQANKSIDEIDTVLEKKISDIENVIRYNQRLLENLKSTRDECTHIPQYLNKFSIREMKPMQVLKTLSDFNAFEEYSNIKARSAKLKDSVTYKGLFREIHFENDTILGERFLILDHVTDPDGETLSYSRCLYTVVEAGRENIDKEIGQKIFQHAKKHHYELLGYCYVGLLLSAYKNSEEIKYLELYIPLKS